MPSSSSASDLSLGSPLTLPCGITLPNRMVKGAMTETIADPATNLPNETHFALYRRWTKGGIGAQLTGNVMVDRRYMEAPGNVAIEAKDEAPERLKFYQQYASSIRDGGAVAIVQLSHSGRQCPISVNSHGLAPSPVQLALPGIPLAISPVGVPKEATLDDIKEIIERFTTSARIAVKAGFDGVQIHAAHGYLLSTFLSPKVNLRTDAYGGSSENRRRLLLEICVSVRQAIGPNKILACKLNSADFQKGGFTEDESLAVIKELTKLQVDFIEVSGGTYENAVMMKSKTAHERDSATDSAVAGTITRASTKQREAYFLQFCQTVRSVVPDSILMCTGGWRSGIAMSHAIREHDCDLIGLARPLCVMPDFPQLLLASPQLKNLDTAVSDAVTLPTYALTVKTPIETVNRIAETALENMAHQACMRRLAAGEEPNIAADSSVSATIYYLTIGFVRLYMYEPRRHPKRAAFYATVAVSGAALLAATLISKQSPKELFETTSTVITQLWNTWTKK